MSEHDGEWATPKRLPFLNNSLLRSLTSTVYKIPPLRRTSTTNTIVAHHIALIDANSVLSIDDWGDANLGLDKTERPSVAQSLGEQVDRAMDSVLSIDDWGGVNLGLDKTERPSVVQSLGEQVDRATDSKAGKVSGKADGLYMCIFVESRCGQAQEKMQITCTQSVI